MLPVETEIRTVHEFSSAAVGIHMGLGLLSNPGEKELSGGC